MAFCEYCSAELLQRENENISNFAKRRFCDKSHARKAQVQIRYSRKHERDIIKERRNKLLTILADAQIALDSQELAEKANENVFTVKDDVGHLVYWGYVSMVASGTRVEAVKFNWWPWQKTKLINLLGGLGPGVMSVLKQDDL